MHLMLFIWFIITRLHVFLFCNLFNSPVEEILIEPLPQSWGVNFHKTVLQESDCLVWKLTFVPLIKCHLQWPHGLSLTWASTEIRQFQKWTLYHHQSLIIMKFKRVHLIKSFVHKFKVSIIYENQTNSCHQCSSEGNWLNYIVVSI